MLYNARTFNLQYSHIIQNYIKNHVFTLVTHTHNYRYTLTDQTVAYSLRSRVIKNKTDRDHR